MIEHKKKYRVAIVDIESTGLRADYAKVMCVVIKEYLHRQKGGRTWTIRIDSKDNPNPYSDKWVVSETFRILKDFDVLVTWNGVRFDKKFLNTRALIHKMPKLHPMFNRDLCNAAMNFLFASRKLKFQASVLLGKTDKTFTTPKVWDALVRHEKWAIDFMVAHCRFDVKDTEKLYKRYLPYLSDKIERR